MTTLDTATRRTKRRHPSPSDPEPEKCPYCGSAITRAIRAKIADMERVRMVEVEETLRGQLKVDIDAA